MFLYLKFKIRQNKEKGENMKKKLLSFVFVLCLIVPAMFCLSACTTESKNINVVQYIDTNGMVYDSNADGGWTLRSVVFAKDNTIPEEILGKSVTRIGKNVFSKSDITSIILPRSIKTIEDSAFAESDLSQIKFDEHSELTNIGKKAFYGTNLETIKMPNSVKYVGDSAFQGCEDLETVNMSNSLKTINKDCFEGCSEIISIELTSNISTIEVGAFENCSKLANITFNESAKLKTIKDNAFSNTYISNLNLPKGLENLGTAFRDCANLQAVDMPSTIKEISYNPFYNCAKLASLSVSPNNNVFYSANDCILTRNTEMLIIGCNKSEIPSKTAIIHNGAFDGSGITSVTIPSSVIVIGDHAFNNCENLGSLEFAEGSKLKELGVSAFAGCGFTEIVLPDKLEVIKGEAFKDTEIASIVIPNSVKYIGENALSDVNTIIFGDTQNWVNYDNGNEVNVETSYSVEVAIKKAGYAIIDYLDNYINS